MKLTKSSIALAAIAGMLALTPSAWAQTNGAAQATPPAGRRGGGMIVESQLNRLSEQLQLTDEQKPKVKALLEERIQERRALRNLPEEERRSKREKLRADTDKKMKAILSADQYKKYEEIRARHGSRVGRGEGSGNGGNRGNSGQ